MRFMRLCALGILVYAYGVTAGAFFPRNLAGGQPVNGQAHERITTDAIRALDIEFFAVAAPTTSMERAIEQIADANALVDDDSASSAKHFDGESFPEGQARLEVLLTAIQNALAAGDAIGARSSLGQALHTIQDFYSHSNWVELGNTTPHPSLGRPASAITRLPAATPTCQACTGSAPCLNCNTNLITNALTSGYYSAQDRVKPNAQKCSHGGLFDASGTILGEGINKDSLDCQASPHHFLHNTAAAVAGEATKQFIRDIRNLVTVRQLKLLLGAGPTLAIAIDTTGSMIPIIDAVKKQAIDIVNARLGTEQEPSKYVLTAFNDPGVGPTTVTDDPTAFKNAINALPATGGGDCPELSMSGMLQALAAADPGGDLFMFTDASSKDANLAGNVSSLALSKDIQVQPMSFGNCEGGGGVEIALTDSIAAFGITAAAIEAASVDPAYRTVADTTGGQLFELSPNEAGTIAKLADFVVRANAVDLLSVADTVASVEKTYSVPVDSGMTRVTFSVSGSTAVVIKRPDGTTVPSSDPSVLSLSTGRVYSIVNPAAGNWTVSIGGTGPFSLDVSGEGDLDLRSFRFLKERGRAGHTGMFPIAGLPVAGEAATTQAVLTGGLTDVQFELRSKTGALLRSLALESLAADLPEFFGQVTPPASPFLVYARGIDQNGTSFQRLLPGQVLAQAVQIVKPVAVDLRAGMLTTYQFEVKNSGSADTFRFTGSDDKGYLVGISPTEFSLGAGESAVVAVSLRPPADATAGTADTLTVTVESTTPDGARNFAVLTSLVGPANRAPIADAGASEQLECSAAATTVTLDGRNSSDPDGDPLTFVWTNAAGAVVGSAAMVNLSLPLGTHTFTLTVSDGHGGSATASVTIVVRDTTQPALSVTLSPAVLWPPDHRLVPITATVQASDRCSATSVVLLSITSNEGNDERGAGTTAADVQGAAVGTDDRAFMLRAERSGRGTGRIYTATYAVRDATGNTRTLTTQVVVPHNR